MSSSSSSDSAWDVIYNGDNNYLPDNANQQDPWEELSNINYSSVESDASCNNGKRLRIDTSTTSSNACWYRHGSGSVWRNNVDNAVGYMVEARLKVVDGGSVLCQEIQVGDGDHFFRVRIMSNMVIVKTDHIAEASDQSYSIDLTDAYHVIQISVLGTALSIKIDGTERITGTLDYDLTTASLSFGDVLSSSNAGGEVYWDYIKYKVT